MRRSIPVGLYCMFMVRMCVCEHARRMESAASSHYSPSDRNLSPAFHRVARRSRSDPSDSRAVLATPPHPPSNPGGSRPRARSAPPGTSVRHSAFLGVQMVRVGNEYVPGPDPKPELLPMVNYLSHHTNVTDSTTLWKMANGPSFLQSVQTKSPLDAVLKSFIILTTRFLSISNFARTLTVTRFDSLCATHRLKLEALVVSHHRSAGDWTYRPISARTELESIVFPLIFAPYADLDTLCTSTKLSPNVARLILLEKRMRYNYQLGKELAHPDRVILTLDRKQELIKTSQKILALHVYVSYGIGVRFVGERGLDYGGVGREWFHEVTKAMVKEGWFVKISGSDTYNINIEYVGEGDVLKYDFFGKLVGLAILEGVPLGIKLSSGLLEYISHGRVGMRHLALDDPVMHASMKELLSNSALPSWAEDLVFTDLDWRNQEVPLVENGASRKVNTHNRFEFVARKCIWALFGKFRNLSKSMKSGFLSVFPPSLLADRVVTGKSLQILLQGNSAISPAGFLHITSYAHPYSRASREILWFWQIVASLNQSQLRALLKFITASETMPIGGFDTKIKIKRVDSENNSRLPTASTCFLTLYLPAYTKKDVMKEKLLLAISEGGGFHIA